VLWVAAVLTALAVGACDAPAPTVAPTPTRAPEATPVTTTYELATDVWYEGLVLHVGQATTVLDARGGTIEVYATIENPEPEPSSLDAAITLAVGGTRVEPTRDSQVPTIPGGESRLALFTFELQEIASAADAVLEIGAAPLHVAKVPFTAAAGEPVVFRPIDVELGGSGAAGELRLALKRAVVRWDLPDWSEQLPAETRAITVTYDATYTGSFSGGFAFTGENVALRLPGGDVVEARRDGHSQSVELIGARKTKAGLFSRFEIPAGATGEFALLVRVGSSERAIRFTIEG
jgi:hypothetical protein